MTSKQTPMPGLRTAEDANPPRLPKPTAEDTKPDIHTALFDCPKHPAPRKQRKVRHLTVSIDGTSNQFSVNSTNVVELFSRIIKIDGDIEQLVYYNSGIGTYAPPSFRSWSYWKQVIYNHIDTAIAWNFEKIVHAAYKWLSENYEPGDRIFLFGKRTTGFSRGAYQVRVIAGMIEKVGLLHKGNENQIAFAYELYTAVTNATRGSTSASPSTGSSTSSQDPPASESTTNTHQAQSEAQAPETREDKLCRTFKRSLCHEHVKVHFVGVWDTVSSIGVFRGKSFPETVSGMGHVCHFRHALALDERRAKFQPEYVNGGLGPIPGDTRGDVKEVWFKGTHSDIGGGNITNEDLNNFSDSLRWMTYEAQFCGLLIKPYTGNWVAVTPKESLTWGWMILELLPFGALAYIDKHTLTWWPHLGQPRKVQPGQLIHQSVFNTLPKRRSSLESYAEGEVVFKPMPLPAPMAYCPKAELYPSLGVSKWTDLFSLYSFVPRLLIIEQDPFQNASHILNSLSQACEALESGQGDRGSASNTLTVGIQTLQSFLDDSTRLSSLLEVPDVDDILLKALTVVVQNTTITLSLESKETLVRLFARAWDPEKQIPTATVPRPLASQVYQWGLEVRKTHRDALFKVLQPFALIAIQPADRVYDNTFLGANPSQIIFTRNLPESDECFQVVSIWDGSTQPAKEILQCRGNRSWISRDGLHVAVADGREVGIINTTTEPLLVIKATDEEEHVDSGDINSLCFADDCQTLACGHQNGWIKLWRREEDQWKVFKMFQGGDDGTRLRAFSRDGSRLVFKISDDGPTKLWSLSDDSLTELEDSQYSISLAWSPSGDWVVAVTWDGNVKIWSPDRGKLERTFKAHDEAIFCLAFRHDGQVLATGSWDHRIRLWRCHNWEKIWEFDIGWSVTSLAFSPDGKRLISGSSSLSLWNVDMGDIEDTA